MKYSALAGDLIENRILPSGSHYMRVMHMAEIDIAGWISIIPWYARQSGEAVQTKAWQEESLGMWHLEMIWMSRDPIWLPKAPQGNGQRQYNALLWWLGSVERVRDGLQEASEAFLGYLGRWPERLLLRSTKGAPEQVTAWSDDLLMVNVAVQAARWIPDRYIVLL